jgi:hypothetical protein
MWKDDKEPDFYEIPLRVMKKRKLRNLRSLLYTYPDTISNKILPEKSNKEFQPELKSLTAHSS